MTEQERYEEIASAILEHLGNRVRITWPNGWQRSGVVGEWRYHSGVCPKLDSKTLMGELVPAVKVEAMNERGRYEEVWAALGP